MKLMVESSLKINNFIWFYQFDNISFMHSCTIYAVSSLAPIYSIWVILHQKLINTRIS